MSSSTDSNNSTDAKIAYGSGNQTGARFALGIWGYYFIAKLLLFWKDLIGFHLWENLVFVAFILLPVNHAIGRRVKLFATMLLAVALLYYDSWLPAFDRVISQASLISGFSATYLVELAGRFISFPVVALLVAALFACWLASRWLRLDTFVILAMIVLPTLTIADRREPVIALAQQQADNEEADWYEQAAQPVVSTPAAQPEITATITASDVSASPAIHANIADQDAKPPESDKAAETVLAEVDKSDESVLDMDKVMQRFFRQESMRSVSFPAPKSGDVPFDVIFVHVCSLSWDDLKVTGLDKHPLWRRFDIMLTRFNSASTYSGPAAIRMQRATCGQSTHSDLYSPAPEKCYLMDSLKQRGFEPDLLLNHDGRFGDFLEIVQSQGLFKVTPLALQGARITQHAFDDTPIYEDLSVLDHWLEGRLKSDRPRVAAYYNTVSLHDGNHLVGSGANLNSQENFKIRLAKLLDDLDQFMRDIEKSGRRAVVAMVPEHGAALRGDRMQIAGLREIPSAPITLVPVGIKVIGADPKRQGDTIKIAKPTSYLAVSYIVARMIEKPPYSQHSYAPSDYVLNLPVTPFVAQNGDAMMAGYKGRYYLRQDESGWIDYTDF